MKCQCSICQYAMDIQCFLCGDYFCNGHLSSQAHNCVKFVSSVEDLCLRVERLEKRVDGIHKFLKDSGGAILGFLGTVRATSKP